MKSNNPKIPIKTIREAFEAIDSVFYSAMVNFATTLFMQVCREERKHRGPSWGTWNEHAGPKTISVADAGRLFAVKRIAEFLNGKPMPDPREFNHTLTSAFIAAGIVGEYEQDLRKALALFDLNALAELNYTDYVQTI